MQKQNSKTEFYKNTAKFLELSIWVLFIALIVSAVVFYNSYCHKNYNRYQIFMQDVDGIIVGSPVRMLGIQVGYVKHIKPVNDMVYIDFVINQKGIEIPKGSMITVEFSGLGGSKSIEIYTPKEKYDSNSGQPIIVQQPRRLGASVSLLNQMFKKIGSIIYRCTYFGKSLEDNSIELKTPTEKKEKEYLQEIEKWLDKQNSRK
ncbi:MCE family protein [bacterium]|nr:MCE family protein [bacterium]